MPRGCVAEAADGRFGRGGAVFDSERRYRYHLSRVWDTGRPSCNFIMLNPSAADARRLDPTTRRAVGFALGWGMGAMHATNCFAWRTAQPRALALCPDPVGPAGDAALLAAARSADLVVAAWGVHAALLDRARRVSRLLAAAGVRLHCLALTRDGHPAHPLYLPRGAVPVPWPPAGEGRPRHEPR